MSARFVPLHVHSHYSLLKALPKIPDLVARAKKEGCEALALTDLGNLHGAIEFYKECKKQKIKPIIGLDAHVGDGPSNDLGTSKRLLLYAKNKQGYQNLLALVTKSHLETPDNPAVTEAMLAEHGEGLLQIDPKDQTIALCETYYLEPADRRAWETLRAIGEGASEAGDINAEETDYSFPTTKTMRERFSEAALQKTRELAAQCDLELELGSWVFPKLDTQHGASYDDELRALAQKGLAGRGLQQTPDIAQRIEYELSIIRDKGFAPYFLVVGDLLRFAREHKILTTIRGSVAGSLVTYLLGITNVNPLEYKLPFERFLNPERPSPPDIDMDYADNRRDEVIEYTRKKYGADRVAQIGTFGTMLARGVVRDVARALGHPYGLGDRIAKEVPFGSQGFPMTLERALRESPELKKMYESEEDTRDIIDLGRKIEGCARHISVHAAGVVIAPGPLQEYVPLQRDPKGGKVITQYDMYSIEEAGLLKFDFLGIRNLSILADSVRLVRKTRGTEVDIENVPVDDEKTFAMLARGETEGTFQLNGSGMTRFLKELRPTTIHDINAMVALFRPGPMETIPSYIERKHNPRLVSYLDPRMKEYLDFSHGLLVYQDDVLLTAIKLGGYSWLEADMLRKAMGKKIPEVMQAEKEKLIKGFIEHGKLSAANAEKLWKLIEPFAAYGFNKAHAASYGKVAYQTAYMKANFPVEYMAAVLTAESRDVDTVGIMVAECKRVGIPVLPPDINESFADFTVIRGKSGIADGGGLPSDDEATSGDFPAGKSPYPESADAALAATPPHGAIRFGLSSIKNFGAGLAESIIAERTRGGRFASLADFLQRVPDQNLNKKGLEALIGCGALDAFGERGAMFAHAEFLAQYHREAAGQSAHDSLFAGLGGQGTTLRLPPAPPAALEQKLVWEKELLGLYVSGHPLDRVRDKIRKHAKPIDELRRTARPGEMTIAAGMIGEIRTILTRGGDQMAFIKLVDDSGTIEAVVFPRNFAQHKAALKRDTCVALKARVSNRNGELSLVAEQLKTI